MLQHPEFFSASGLRRLSSENVQIYRPKFRKLAHPNVERNICVLGMGYVGSTNAIGFAEHGHTVVCFEIDPSRRAKLRTGSLPYDEPGFGEPFRNHLAEGRILVAEMLETAVAAAEIIIVAVNTPLSPEGCTDLSDLYNVAHSLAKLDIGEKTVVLRATVPPGTTEHFEAILQCRNAVLYVPEFLREGSALRDFAEPERLVVGCSDKSYAGRFLDFLAPGVPEVFIMSLAEAELSKSVANAFLATKISFANEIANICGALGADVSSVLSAVGSDSRIGHGSFRPGIGYGGPCLDKDIRSLQNVAASRSVKTDMLSATIRTNERQPIRAIELLEEELGSLNGRVVGVWGLTFKSGTTDKRYSLALGIIDILNVRGAIVKAYDPSYSAAERQPSFEVVESAEAATYCDALLLLTDWSEFQQFDPAILAQNVRLKIIIDGRNCLDREVLASHGLRSRGIGK